MADRDDKDMAAFQLSEEGAAFWKLRVTFREVEVRFLFRRNEQGINELKTLMESQSLPRIIGFAFHQIEVREAMQNIDAELEALLGDSE